MILDMDAFKNVNDLYDRMFGDEILRITAGNISAMLLIMPGFTALTGMSSELSLPTVPKRTRRRSFQRSRISIHASRSTAERNITVPYQGATRSALRMRTITWTS